MYCDILRPSLSVRGLEGSGWGSRAVGVSVQSGLLSGTGIIRERSHAIEWAVHSGRLPNYP